MNQPVPPSFLFHYSLSIQRCDDVPRNSRRLFNTEDLQPLLIPAVLSGESSELGLAAAWNPDGLALRVTVTGKTMPVSGRWSDPGHSDWILIHIDTRHTANVHRATEFCTAVAIFPCDDDNDEAPSLQFRAIAQQRTPRRESGSGGLKVQCSMQSDGYELDVWLPAAQLPGFADAAGIGHIGFSLLVTDQELGKLPLLVGGDFPTDYDPSTWLQLQLTDSNAD